MILNVREPTMNYYLFAIKTYLHIHRFVWQNENVQLHWLRGYEM